MDRKIADYYRAFMDEAAIEAAGLEPIAQDLERLTKAELLSAAADPPALWRLPINTYVGLDPRNPDRYITFVLHGGLGLPDREYYLSDKFAEVRAKYQAHIAKLLTLAGQTDGAAKAQRILALETSIAKLHWSAAERRDRDRRLLKTRAELLALTEGYPMQAELQAIGRDQQAEFIVRESDALHKLAALFRSTPLAQWREYMIYACISAHAQLLPKVLADERFEQRVAIW